MKGFISKKKCWLARVGNSLFCSLLFCSKWLILNSDHEQFAKSLFTKEQLWAIRSCRSLQKSNREGSTYVVLYKRAMWANCSCHSLKKSDVSDLLLIWAKNESFAQKNGYFSYVLEIFPPFLCPRATCSPCSSLICSFLKSDLSDLLPSLLTKEKPWVICSGCSWQKSNRSDSLSFSWANRSFAHKNE